MADVTDTSDQRSMNRGWIWVLVVVLASTFGLWALGASSKDSESNDQPGDARVYEEIDATSDCDKLQVTFDRNMNDAERRGTDDPLRDVVLAYAAAADDRMSDIGCYG